MNQPICPECDAIFFPSSARQHFCSPACAHRQRQRKYRKTRQSGSPLVSGRNSQPETNSHEAIAALTALYEAALRQLRSAGQRRLDTLSRSYEDKLAAAYEHIHDSTQSESWAALKADELESAVQRLQHENAQLLARERQATKDSQQLAVRVLASHRDANTRLDRTTAAIFARRGWNTTVGKS